MRFDLWVFVENLVVHMFNLLPLVLYREGWQGLVSRSFCALNPMFFFQWASFICFYTAIILYIIFRPVNISPAEVVLMAFSFLLRQCVVATKYAYMTKPELEERLSKGATRELRTQQEVITIWTFLKKSTIEQQLHLASVRKKIDLKRYIFEVPEREAAEYAETETYDSRFNAFNIGLEILQGANAAERKTWLLLLA